MVIRCLQWGCYGDWMFTVEVFMMTRCFQEIAMVIRCLQWGWYGDKIFTVRIATYMLTKYLQ